MSWLGAGIGAGIGAFIGGPIGAGIGAWIGSRFGNGEKEVIVVCPECKVKVKVTSEGEWACPNCGSKFIYGEESQKNQTIFFVTFFSMLAKMAKTDGVVSATEINAVTAIFKEMNLDEQDKKAAIEIFNNAKNSDASIYDFADQYSRLSDREMVEILYAMLWKVAMADRSLHHKEDEILKEITIILGLPQQRYFEYKSGINMHPGEDINQCYEILGASSTDSDQDIKRKYRKLVAEFHPDKIQAKGLPESFQKAATEQMQKINAAYDSIKKQRNMS